MSLYVGLSVCCQSLSVFRSRPLSLSHVCCVHPSMRFNADDDDTPSSLILVNIRAMIILFSVGDRSGAFTK